MKLGCMREKPKTKPSCSISLMSFDYEPMLQKTQMKEFKPLTGFLFVYILDNISHQSFLGALKFLNASKATKLEPTLKTY